MPPKIFPPLPKIIHLLKETMTEQLMMVYSFIIHNHCHHHRKFVYVINQAVQTMQLSSTPTSAAKRVDAPNNSTKDVSLTTATDCSMIFTHISACADPLNLAPQTQMTPMRTNILFGSFNLLKRLHYEWGSICEDVLAEQLLRVGMKPSSDLQADKKHGCSHTNNEAMHGAHYGTVWYNFKHPPLPVSNSCVYGWPVYGWAHPSWTWCWGFRAAVQCWQVWLIWSGLTRTCWSQLQSVQN